MHTFAIIAPIFLLILIGVGLRRSGFLGGDAPRFLSRYCYWIALPALLFLKIGLAEADMSGAARTLAICSAVTLSLAALGLAIGFTMRLSPARAVTLMHVAMRGNLAYVGMSVVIFAFKGQAQAGQAEAVAALTLGPLIILYNLLPSIGHVLATHGRGRGVKRRVLAKLATNPLILSSLLGLLWNLGVGSHDVALPQILHRSFSLLADSALPLALLCVGCGLADTSNMRAVLPASVAAGLKVLVSILLTLLFARWLQAGPIETAVALILMAAPTAIASFILVEELEGDTNIAASTITITTIVSLLTLPLALMCAGM